MYKLENILFCLIILFQKLILIFYRIKKVRPFKRELYFSFPKEKDSLLNKNII